MFENIRSLLKEIESELNKIEDSKKEIIAVDEILSPEEASLFVGVHYETILRAKRQGKITHAGKQGKKYLFAKSELEKIK